MSRNVRFRDTRAGRGDLSGLPHPSRPGSRVSNQRPTGGAVTGLGDAAGMGHLLGYARVSTTDQQPALQVDALTTAGCYRVFTETASGARTDRPVLARVLDQLRPGDTLVVWKLDRLGRSLRHLVDTVTGLADRGIGFRSLQESIDTTTPGGRLVFHVFASLAEFERDLIRERTTAGLVAARARGRNGGRPPVLDPGQVELARELYASHRYTTAEIARRLKVGRSTLYRYLEQEQTIR